MNYRKYVPIIVLIFFLVISFLIIKPFLIALFLGALFAYVTYPFYDILKNKIKESIAAFLILFLVLLIIVVPTIFFVEALVSQSYTFYFFMKEKLTVGIFDGCTHDFCKFIGNLASQPDLALQIDSGLESFTNWIISKGTNFLRSIPGLIINLFVMLFSMFYFLKDGNKLIKSSEKYLGFKKKDFKKIRVRLNEIVNGVVFGYLVVAFIQGALGAIGFFIFGVSSPLFWGLLMAFLALIPYIGTGVIWGPAALFLVFDGIIQNSNSLILKGIGLAIYSIIFVSSLDNLIRPYLVGDKAKIHPAVAMLGILGGLFLFGPIGVILGPLLLSLTLVGFNIAFAGRFS